MRYIIHSGPGIGDILQVLPMACEIKKTDKDSIVDLIMNANDYSKYLINLEILRNQKYVDHLYWYSSKKLLHIIPLIFKLRRTKYTYGILRYGSPSKAGKYSEWIYRIMRCAGVSKIVSDVLPKADIKVPLENRVHYLKRDEKLLSAIGIKHKLNPNVLDKKMLYNNYRFNMPIVGSRKIIGISRMKSKM